jgi:hypothetical protein
VKNSRKLIMYLVAVGSLAAALAFCYLDFVARNYETFAYGLGAVTGTAMAGNVGEHFARRRAGLEVLP